MAKFSRTWWGDKFIQALEDISDDSRLKRGRSYARNGKVKSFSIQENCISAKVRGSVNPYFGVYKEPTYKINIEIKPIAKTKWNQAIDKLSSKASIVSRLLLNEVPENIEDTFSELGLNLLPHSQEDFKTNCSCPDYANPCKHIAGVYYLVASQLDQNPFLLFELRGLSKTELQDKLVFGESVGQAFAFVSTGNADLGWLAFAQVKDPLLENEQGAIWLPSSDLYDPIKQDAVLLNRALENEAAVRFLSYLGGPDARAIIRSQGFEKN